MVQAFKESAFESPLYRTCLLLRSTDVALGRYGNSSGRVSGGPAFWFENLKAEISKIVSKKNNLLFILFLCPDKKYVPHQK